MQETIIYNLQLCNQERTFQNNVILKGEIILKNAKVIVKGMLWVYGHSKISIENSTIIADKVLIDPILDKYENSKIEVKEVCSFDY